MTRAHELAAEGARHLAVVRGHVGKLRKSRSGKAAEAWDAPIREALARPDAPPEAREAWEAAQRTWWTLAQHETSDLVRRLAFHGLGGHHDRSRRDDLEQAAALGTYRAAQTWDPEEGAAWRTYARAAIWGAISNFIRQSGDGPLSGIQRRREIRTQLDWAQQQLERQGHPVTLEAVAEFAGISPKVAAALDASTHIVRLDQKAGPEGGTQLHELIGMDSGTEELVAEHERLGQLHAAIEDLPKVWREVIRARLQGLSCQKIAKKLRITRQAVQYREQKAISLLRLAMRAA